MRPTDGFHRLATAVVGYAPNVTRLPYPGAPFSERFSGRITSVTADLFPGDVLVSRVSAKLSAKATADLRPLLNDLQSLRSAKNVDVVDGLAREIAALSTGKRNASRRGNYTSFFMMNLQLPHASEAFAPAVDNLKRELAALLIGTKNPEMLRDDVVESVYAACEELNAKAAAELLLVNRQGVLRVVPAGNYRGPHLHRFDRTRDLAILACYGKSYLRDSSAFSWKHPFLAEMLGRRLEQWINHADVTFDVSMSHTLTWAALVNAMLLPQRLSAWRRFLEEDHASELSNVVLQDPWWSPRSMATLRSLDAHEDNDDL